MFAPAPDKMDFQPHLLLRSLETPSPRTPTTPVSAGKATARDIKEEFITQRIKSWLARERPIPPDKGLENFYSMSTDVGPAPETERGIAIPSQKGYKFVPFDNGPIVDRNLKRRCVVLDRWSSNPANFPILKEIEVLLAVEAEAEGWWLSREKKEAIMVMDTLERVKQYAQICAEGRLMSYRQTAHAPPGSGGVSRGFYKFCVCRIDDFGSMTTEWASLPWSASPDDFVRHIGGTRPGVDLEYFRQQLFKRLNPLCGAESVANRVRDIRKAVEDASLETDAWSCSLCDKEDSDRNADLWIPISSRDKFAIMLEEAKGQNKLLLFIRSWQERLYRLSCEIQQIERSAFPPSNDKWGPLPFPLLPPFFSPGQHDFDRLFDNDGEVETTSYPF